MRSRPFFSLPDRLPLTRGRHTLTLYEMDCPDCVEFVYDLLTHQDGVQTVVTNVDGNFFTVSFDDEVCSVGVLVDALEMFGYYPVVLDI